MLLFITLMAVITTMIEKTPINTPNSVSAERSLCVVSALMAMVKLSRSSASRIVLRLLLIRQFRVP